MPSFAQLHAVVAQTKEGSVLYYLGNLGKDTSLVSGYISAFYTMDSEFKVNNVNYSGIKYQFYKIGDVTLIVTGMDKLTVYTVFNEVEADLIDELVEFTKMILNLFKKEVWEELGEEHKNLGVIPPDILEKFENHLFSLVISKPWCGIIYFSQLFLSSDAIHSLALFMLDKFMKKILKSFGISGFWSLIDSIIKSEQIKPIFRKIFRPSLKGRDSIVNVQYLKNINLHDFSLTTLYVLYRAVEKIRDVINKNVLNEFNVLRGVTEIVLPESFTY